MPSLERRLAALESAAPATAKPSVVLITPMAARGCVRVPEMYSFGGMTLRRKQGEDASDFESRVAAAAREASPNRISIVVCVASTEYPLAAELS